MSAATLRPMRWQDIPRLLALERVAFPQDAWSEPTWWAELAGRPRRDYAVLERQGRLVGYAGLDQSGEVADVMTIAVDPAARGGGLGRRLLEHLLAVAAAGGARWVMLEVRADNTAALELYRRFGFEVVHTRRGYYRPEEPGGESIDALVLRAEVGE